MRQENDHEALGDSHSAISTSLRALPRVEAPRDFEFRVKARIAASNPGGYKRPAYAKAFAYAMPVFLLTAIVSIYFFGQFSGVQELSSTPPASEAPAQKAMASPPAETSSQAAPSAATQPQVSAAVPTVEDPVIAETARATVEPATQAARVKNPGPGIQLRPRSFDSALTPAEQILPRGFENPAGVTNRQQNLPSPPKVDVAQILKMIGIDAQNISNRWKVFNVAGIAERSGIKVGDIVDSLDDLPLAGKTSLAGRVDVKRLKIDRGGTRIEITLKSQ